MELKWNWLAYNFDQAMKDVRRVYDIAIDALEVEMNRRAQALDDCDAALKRGDAAEPERNDNGNVNDDPRDWLIYDVNVVEDAINKLRKSMAISLFHTWERVGRETVKLSDANFTDLIEALRAAGIETGSSMRWMARSTIAEARNSIVAKPWPKSSAWPIASIRAGAGRGLRAFRGRRSYAP